MLTPEGEVLALLPENQGASGERGHVTIQATGPHCNCGNYGFPEALASGTAIQRCARKIANENLGSVLGSSPLNARSWAKT